MSIHTFISEAIVSLILLNVSIESMHSQAFSANSFKNAVISGRQSYLAGRMKKNYFGSPSSPLDGLI